MPKIYFYEVKQVNSCSILLLSTLACTNIRLIKYRRIKMTINEYLRLIAGTMVLLSVLLAQLVSPQWFWLTVFIGVNLLQSSFTKWCPMITLLQKLKVKG
jgi:hypothetical protein